MNNIIYVLDEAVTDFNTLDNFNRAMRDRNYQPICEELEYEAYIHSDKYEEFCDDCLDWALFNFGNPITYGYERSELLIEFYAEHCEDEYVWKIIKWTGNEEEDDTSNIIFDPVNGEHTCDGINFNIDLYVDWDNTIESADYVVERIMLKNGNYSEDLTDDEVAEINKEFHRRMDCPPGMYYTPGYVRQVIFPDGTAICMDCFLDRIREMREEDDFEIA